MLLLEASPYILRPFQSSDAESFAVAVRESMPSLGVWMPWANSAYTEQQALDWFAMCDASRANGSAHEFGIFLDNSIDFVGGAGLNQFNTTHHFCNLGYWVRNTHQRQGAAVAAVHALCKFAFETLDQARVEIVVASGNTPSQGVAMKARATYECLAQNRLRLYGASVAAHVYSLHPAVV